MAPTSAPMFAMVAFPVAERVAEPGPTYSRMAFVPPEVVRRPATHRITSLRCSPAVQPSGESDGDASRIRHLPGQTGHGEGGVAPPTPTAHAPSPPAFGVCESVPRISAPGKAVGLEHDLVDDPGTRLPEAGTEARGSGAQEGIDLVVLRERVAQVRRRADAGLHQVVAVDGRRHRDARAAHLGELEHRGLPEDVLEDHAIRAEAEQALPGRERS